MVMIMAGMITWVAVGQGLPPTPRGAGGPRATGSAGAASPAGGNAGALVVQGEALMAEGRLTEAREAFRSAIRVEPMNPSHWNRYDEAIERLFVIRAREDKRSPVIDRDLTPFFSIDRVESYRDLGTLYLVGEVRNLTKNLKRMVEVVGILYDQDKVELRRNTSYLLMKERGVYPNEVSPFEIPFKDPPAGIKSYRVQVTSFE